MTLLDREWLTAICYPAELRDVWPPPAGWEKDVAGGCGWGSFFSVMGNSRQLSVASGSCSSHCAKGDTLLILHAILFHRWINPIQFQIIKE